MKPLATHCWFDKEAGEAANLYTSLFENSRILEKIPLPGTPGGDAELYIIELAGQEFQLISAGPIFRLNPSISLRVDCETEAEARRLWDALSAGGFALMDFQPYDFSPLYGWCADRFGLNWQIMTVDHPVQQKIIPAFCFVGEVCGKAEQAMQFYTGIFPNSCIDFIARYPEGSELDKPGTVMLGAFNLMGQAYSAMDSAYDHAFAFNEAVSFIVRCENQAEIDHYWALLSKRPEAEACGWCKDEFGVSWQVVPVEIEGWMNSGDPAANARVRQAMYPMKKLNLSALEAAFRGE